MKKITGGTIWSKSKGHIGVIGIDKNIYWTDLKEYQGTRWKLGKLVWVIYRIEMSSFIVEKMVLWDDTPDMKDLKIE